MGLPAPNYSDFYIKLSTFSMGLIRCFYAQTIITANKANIVHMTEQSMIQYIILHVSMRWYLIWIPIHCNYYMYVLVWIILTWLIHELNSKLNKCIFFCFRCSPIYLLRVCVMLGYKSVSDNFRKYLVFNWMHMIGKDFNVYIDTLWFIDYKDMTV